VDRQIGGAPRVWRLREVGKMQLRLLSPAAPAEVANHSSGDPLQRSRRASLSPWAALYSQPFFLP